MTTDDITPDERRAIEERCAKATAADLPIMSGPVGIARLSMVDIPRLCRTLAAREAEIAALRAALQLFVDATNNRGDRDNEYRVDHSVVLAARAALNRGTP